MNSPFLSSNADYLDRQIATSPDPSVGSFSEGRPDSLRSMKLKIHYTFDNENKTNHLVRYRDEVKIRTAFLDESTQIGVIELKTCVNAICNASPEIIAGLGHDFTIYAYDYSEYETPLVGQGMLSWVLASSKPSAPAEQSNTMVTGRVSRNLGLFAGGSPETLEVKLRLVPVPTSLQSEYIDSMNKYRELSMVMPEGFDFQGWNNFLQTNPGILSVIQSSASRPSSSTGTSGNVGIEHVQRLMNHGYIPAKGQARTSFQQPNAYSSFDTGAELMRYGSPAPSVQSTRTTCASLGRSASRASNYAEQIRGRQESSSGPPDSGYLSNDERTDDGRPKKRAKVTQASHPGKSSLGKKVDSLRVAASTAASVRVHQPTAVRPSGNPVSNLEEPPRVPTPIPQTTNQLRHPRLLPSRSNLTHESYSAAESGYKSPYLASKESPSAITSAATSPETDHVPDMDDSPQDPASSPPVIPDNAPYQSSPALPSLPMGDDSGLISGPLDELSTEENDDCDRPVNEEDIEIAKQYSIRPDIARPSSEKSTAKKAPSRSARASKKPQAPKDAIAISHDKARRAISLKRSQTWSGEAAPSPTMTADAPKEPESAAISPKEAPKGKANRTKWDKDKRKLAVQNKLNRAVTSGALPPFCEVCGAIETPTWRKAFSKIYSGSAEGVKVSKGEGAVVCCQVLETNKDGSTKLFKVFKKSLLDSDDGFSEFLLCNPCGLWLANRNKLRPENLWNLNEKRKDDRERPPRPTRSKKRRASYEPTSDVAGSQFDVPSDMLNVPAQDEPTSSPMEQGDVNETERLDEPDLPPIGGVDGSGESSEASKAAASPQNLLDPDAYAALERAIQSSPNRFRGSKTSPIKIDEGNPDPVRRALFSSPRTSGLGEVNLIGRKSPNSKTPPAVSTSVKNCTTAPGKPSLPNLSGDIGQETLPTRSVSPDPFQDLTKTLAPVTPSKANKHPSTKTPSDLFKTPTQKSSQSHRRISTDDFFSSAAKAFLHAPQTPSRTPSRIRAQSLEQMTPFTRNLNTLLSDAMGQDSPSRFFGMLGDVRALPPLNNENSGAIDFDFSDFNPTSDLGLTSSPPRWFGPSADDTEGGLWEDVGFGSSPVKGPGKGVKETQESTIPAAAA